MLPKKWQNVRFAIYNFSGSSSMTKPKSYVPKERTEQQKAILDEARKRAHAVLREKNKIVKSMKEEKAETQEKKEEKNKRKKKILNLSPTKSRSKSKPKLHQ